MKTFILKVLNKLSDLLIILIQNIEIHSIKDYAVSKGLRAYIVGTEGGGLTARRVIVESDDEIEFVFTHKVTGRPDLVISRINRRFGI